MIDYLIAFEALTANQIAALKTICSHGRGLHQFKVNRRFQPLVTLGLVYIQSLKSGHGVRYKVHHPVLVHFESWVKGAIAS